MQVIFPLKTLKVNSGSALRASIPEEDENKTHANGCTTRDGLHWETRF